MQGAYMKNKSIEREPKEERGLFAGYKPNRLSLYLLMISAGRSNELYDVILKDMEQYKIK